MWPLCLFLSLFYAYTRHFFPLINMGVISVCVCVWGGSHLPVKRYTSVVGESDEWRPALARRTRCCRHLCGVRVCSQLQERHTHQQLEVCVFVRLRELFVRCSLLPIIKCVCVCVCVCTVFVPISRSELQVTLVCENNQSRVSSSLWFTPIQTPPLLSLSGTLNTCWPLFLCTYIFSGPSGH